MPDSRPEVLPVVLCGGAGSRLWPLSQPHRPKPLLPLPQPPATLLGSTLARLRAVGAPRLVAGEAHRDMLRAAFPEVPMLVEIGRAHV